MTFLTPISITAHPFTPLPRQSTWADIGTHAGQIFLIITVAVVIWFLVRFALNLFVKSVRKGVDEATKENSSSMSRQVGKVFKGKRSLRRSEAIASLLRNTCTVIIVIVAVLCILSVLNIPVGPVLAGVSVASIILGLGAQQIIKDFLSGIFILFEDQFAIGDEITIGDVIGIVTSMEMRITTIVDNDGVIWYFRNGEITQLGNFSKGRQMQKHYNEEKTPRTIDSLATVPLSRLRPTTKNTTPAPPNQPPASPSENPSQAEKTYSQRQEHTLGNSKTASDMPFSENTSKPQKPKDTL